MKMTTTNYETKAWRRRFGKFARKKGNGAKAALESHEYKAFRVVSQNTEYYSITDL